MKLANTRFVFVVGPTSAGKGFVFNLLMKTMGGLRDKGLNIAVISFGQIIRDLMKESMDFCEKFEELVRNGKLLDDETAIGLFENELSKITALHGAPDIIFVDGFCRTTVQINHSIQNGYLQEKDSVFILNASFDTCLERFAHRVEKDRSRTETEVDTFRNRYHLHADTIRDIRALFKETDAVEVDIDADQDIPQGVFPEFLGQLLPVILEASQRIKETRASRD